MRPSTLVGLALLIGAVTAFLAARLAGQTTHASALGLAPVVVAAQSIEAGVAMTASQVKVVHWPSADLPAQALRDPAAVAGRVTRLALQAGEPLLESKLAPVDARAGLAAMIAPGKRAISVRVNEVIAVAGFTLPGSLVDILVSGKDLAQQPFARVVITRVRVLAIAQETAADPAKPKVVNAVTLELTPQEAERLDLARSVGTLSLVLRNEADLQSAPSAGTRLPDILGPSPAPTFAPEAVTEARINASVRASPRPRPAATGAASADPATRFGGVLEIRGLTRSEGRP